MSNKPTEDAKTPETTGHEWDGIQELNNPLPRWWLWTLYATIIWGIGYTIAYPAWPLISSTTRGVLNHSTRMEVARDIEAHQNLNAGLVAQLNAADLSQIAPDADLHRYGVARGRSVFAAQCSQCHGSGAAGSPGYPNLLDNDWLWGGDLAEISYSVRHGIRNDTDEEARYSDMPAFQDILADDEIDAVAEYVFALTDADHDRTLAEAGATLFADNCAACHGEDARGDRDLGAPNLADAIWLYGGSRAALTQTISQSRFGVMPAWGQRLSEEDVRAVSIYVHALGGGE